MTRARNWFRQAEKDLRHAETAIDAGNFERCCFAAQQEAESAVKALYRSLHLDAFGHSISRITQDLPSALKASPDLLERVKELDKHYVPGNRLTPLRRAVL